MILVYIYFMFTCKQNMHLLVSIINYPCYIVTEKAHLIYSEIMSYVFVYVFM